MFLYFLSFYINIYMQSNTYMTKHRKLNTGQLEVLDLLFKYRFGTSELIAKIKNTQNGTAIRSRLNILLKQGLIDRRYNGRDKLQGKFAAYFLTSNGMKALEQYGVRTDLQRSVKKQVYRLNNVSEDFITHCLCVFTISSQLKNIYGEQIKLFTKLELAKYEYFPQPLPDAFISLKSDGATHRYLLDFIETNTPSFALNRRLKEYVNYQESEEWEVTNSDFPPILFVCRAKNQEPKLHKRAESLGSDLEVYSTSLEALASASEDQDAIWTGELEETKKISLGA